MKKVFLVLFSFYAICSFGQKINDYEFVLVPTQFEFQKAENDYRLNTILKFRLEEYGFQVNYISAEMDIKYNDRCQYMTAEVIDESRLFMTKLAVVFKDCNGKVIYKSKTGTSKSKDRKLGYTEALEEALKSVAALNYKYEGKVTENNRVVVQPSKPISVEKTEKVNTNALFAQPISNGFQLVDTTPKVILKMFKTSEINVFLASSGDRNGVIFKKNEEWFFEYYGAEKLISEKLIIKF